MATSKSFAQYVLSHSGEEGRIRAMFGEYALYYLDQVTGLICDNTVYIKQTTRTSAFLEGKTEKGPPYPGAKDHYIIPESIIEDRSLFLEILEGCSIDVSMKKKPKRKKG